MIKADLVAGIAAKAGLTKVASEKALEAFLEAVQEVLQSEKKLTLTGFGTFSVEARSARKGRNPRTGATITIPAANAVKFRPGKALKDAVK